MSGPKLPPYRLDGSTGTPGQVLGIPTGGGDVQFVNGAGTIWVPLTAGLDLVFDGDDNLILVEVPRP